MRARHSGKTKEVILNPVVDHSRFDLLLMIHKELFCHQTFTSLVISLQGRLHNFCGTWLRCNFLEWNNHSASLRLALHPKNRTLHPVQLPDLG
ncbi:hypothetical protein C8R32_10388 [Nitrosospira sp. Nsp5]|uniref:Uncharacterized protein n=1 Tax=Nitrosospira multiformis TaxID=1231 RepID=A0ABY0T5Y5_9PROT|nr:hypothetical protein C8R32_10388 [Nitrosospira sp. Nsp5]SDQ29212.1 hypothetical protein SAMN05216402_0225 [Nitrosospira multiformis]